MIRTWQLTLSSTEFMTLKRIKISDDDETKLLIKSRRRCALCFGLENDCREKNGQIAHIDKNRRNPDINNLAFLCFDHHDRYDSSSSQSKGIKKKELIKHRDNLYNYISEWEAGKLFNKDNLNLLADLVDRFDLYVASKNESNIGCPFVAINAVENHAVFISENMFSVDHCNPCILEYVSTGYRNAGVSFYIPVGAIKALLKERLKEKYFYINYYISSGKVSKIEFGLNHEDARNARVYMLDRSFELIDDEDDYWVKVYLSDKEAINKVLELLSTLPLDFINRMRLVSE